MKKFKCFLCLSAFGFVLLIMTIVILSNRSRFKQFLIPGTRYQRNLELAQCKRFRRKEPINYNSLYYYKKPDNGNSLIWCKVPKAGSTTLTHLLLRLAGARESTDDKNTTKVHGILRNYYPKLERNETYKILKSIKFLVVRDPFERILSAYRDKLEDYQRDLHFRNGYYYEKFGKFMVPKQENTTRVPTWPEFVNYLINTSVARYDEHWMPITRLCSPCSIDYDYVVRMEHFEEEIQLPLKRAGIHVPKLGWYHTIGSGNKAMLYKYFDSLTLFSIKKLYSKYKRDFQFFGYTPYKYFKLN